MLIQKYKPEYVIIQYSPWLINRGVSVFAPVYFGSLPTPYFFDNEQGFGLMPPLYKSENYNLDIQTLHTKLKASNYLFTLLPFIIKDDLLFLNAKLKIMFGSYKKPTANKTKAEFFAYSKIVEIAKTYNTKVILLNLYNNKGIENLNELISEPNVFLADADALLKGHIKAKAINSMDFRKVYGHLRTSNKDTIYVDYHPNPLVHKIISRSIIQIINKK